MLFKLLDTRNVEKCFLRGLALTHSLTHSGVDSVRNCSIRTRVPEPDAMLEEQPNQTYFGKVTEAGTM